MSEYTDTILIECNRKQSPEFLSQIDADNPAYWTNKVGDGIKLDIGDQISVHSAYMSAIGNESATIEIKGQNAKDNLGNGQLFNMSDTTKVKTTNASQQGDILYTYTPTTITKEINDNEINLTHSYYKTTNGEYYFTLPRKASWESNINYRGTPSIWNAYQKTTNGYVIPSPYLYLDDYALNLTYRGQADGSIPYNGFYNNAPNAVTTNINNDGSRYTLFVKDYIGNTEKNASLIGHRDPALFTYNWYKRTHTYKIEEGFNSPANVAQSFTDQLNNVLEVDTYQQTFAAHSDRKNRNFDITATSRTNEPFPCAFGFGHQTEAAELYLTGGGNPDLTVAPGVVTITSQNDRFAQNANYISVTSAEYGNVAMGMFIIEDNNSLPGGENLVGHMVIDKAQEPSGKYKIYFDRYVSQTAGATAGNVYKLNYRNTTRDYEYYYQACYATIGYKRPELQETGRQLDEAGFGDSPQYTIDGSFYINSLVEFPLGLSNEYIIETSLDWNDTNLSLMKNFFDQQDLYPELFNTSNMSAEQAGLIQEPDTLSIDNSRYIHMNLSDISSVEVYSTANTAPGNFDIPVNSVTGLSAGMVLIEDNSVGDFPMDYSSSNDRTSIRTYIEFVNVSTSTLRLSQKNGATTGSGSGFTLVFSRAKLGSDNYGTTNASYESWSGALFFDYNKDRKDLNEGEGQAPDVWNNLRYGWGVKTDNSKIGLYFGKYRNGIPQTWFDGGVQIQPSVRNIGFDKHFNAYSTASLCLYNGLVGKFGNEYDKTTAGKYYRTYQDRQDLEGEANDGGSAGEFVSSYTLMSFESNAEMNEIYCGANDPVLDFDADQSRFVFRRLHTGETVGTDAAQISASQSVADSEVICYKINKRLSRLNYSPNFTPYNNTILGTGSNELIVLDKNIIPYSIMDARSGIYFESYGCDEKNWSQSLWTLLGFSYSQLHQTEDNRLVRYNNLALKCSTPTTNALVETTDLQLWDRQDGLLSVNPEAIPYPQYYNDKSASLIASSTLVGYQDFPAIVQSCSSTGIVAENLPRKMISPIYLVKTDLLSPAYIGGPESTSKLPVIAVVPKNSGYGDFYNGGEDTVFTNTIPRTIQSITTSISDADGSDSRLDDGSCVIYKIQKQIQSNSQVIQDIMNPPSTSRK